VVVAKFAAAGLIDRLGKGSTARITCVVAVIGNLIVAASPLAAAVGLGRLLCGGSLGLALVLGPVPLGGRPQVGR